MNEWERNTDMETREISAGLWLRSHPITKEKNRAKREKYINFLAFYVRPGVSRFSDSLFALYQEVILGDETYEPIPDPKITGLFKYRYALYMDIWLISAFQDKEKAAALLDELEKRTGLGRNYRKKLRQLYERLYFFDNGVKFYSAEKMIDIWRRNRNYFRRPAQRIVFTANMSAGKSTLINAIVGKKVNRSQSMACTAKLHYIWNKPCEDGFSAEDDNILNLDADYMTLMTDDEGNHSSEITVSTYFRLSFGRPDPLCLLDTPGVNSALDRTHKEITDAAIAAGDFDRLVYVINADGSIATDDEHAYMAQLKATVKAPVLFAVNKLDSFRTGQDSIPESLEKIREDVERLGFEGAMVCPVSAYTGYLAKRAMYDGDLDEDEQEELDNLRRLFRKETYNLSAYYPEKVLERCRTLIGAQKDPERIKYLQLLYRCGILPFEYLLMKRKEG